MYPNDEAVRAALHAPYCEEARSDLRDRNDHYAECPKCHARALAGAFPYLLAQWADSLTTEAVMASDLPAAMQHFLDCAPDDPHAVDALRLVMRRLAPEVKRGS